MAGTSDSHGFAGGDDAGLVDNWSNREIVPAAFTEELIDPFDRTATQTTTKAGFIHRRLPGRDAPPGNSANRRGVSISTCARPDPNPAHRSAGRTPGSDTDDGVHTWAWRSTSGRVHPDGPARAHART